MFKKPKQFGRLFEFESMDNGGETSVGWATGSSCEFVTDIRMRTHSDGKKPSRPEAGWEQKDIERRRGRWASGSRSTTKELRKSVYLFVFVIWSWVDGWADKTVGQKNMKLVGEAKTKKEKKTKKMKMCELMLRECAYKFAEGKEQGDRAKVIEKRLNKVTGGTIWSDRKKRRKRKKEDEEWMRKRLTVMLSQCKTNGSELTKRVARWGREWTKWSNDENWKVAECEWMWMKGLFEFCMIFG